MLGVYDHPADPDLPGVKSVSVGDSFPAKLAKDLTGVTNKVSDILDSLIPL